MKRLLLCAALSLVAACSDNMLTAPVDRQFTIAVGDVVAIAGTPLVLKFERVTSDFRCPENVACSQSILAGNATLEFDAAMNGGRTRFTLNTTQEPNEFVVGDYTIRIAGLSPNRQVEGDIPAKEYRASLVVTSDSD